MKTQSTPRYGPEFFYDSTNAPKTSHFKADIKDFSSPMHVVFYIMVGLAVFEVLTVR